MSKYSKIYFLGIGGIGMSAIARYYKFKGYPVAGYDRTQSELTLELEKEGIDIHYKDDPDYIPKDVASTSRNTATPLSRGHAYLENWPRGRHASPWPERMERQPPALLWRTS